MADYKLCNKKKAEETVREPKDKSRRSALKKLAIGAGVLAGYQVLPKQWTKPLIEQVVLPAHAQVSGVTLLDPCENLTLVSGNQGSANVIIKIQGSVSPATANITINISATVTGGTGETTTNSTTTDASGNYSLVMTVHGGPGITSVSVEITSPNASGSAHCSVYIPNLDSNESDPECGDDDYCAPLSITGGLSGQIYVNGGTPGCVDQQPLSMVIHNNGPQTARVRVTFTYCDSTTYTTTATDLTSGQDWTLGDGTNCICEVEVSAMSIPA